MWRTIITYFCCLLLTCGGSKSDRFVSVFEIYWVIFHVQPFQPWDMPACFQLQEVERERWANACELKSNIFCNFGQAMLTMLLIRPVLICMILSPLIQYDLDIPHKCRATVLDLLLDQKFPYLLNKRIVCRENRLLALVWMWLRSTRRAARRQIGRWDAQQRFTLELNS